MYPERTAGQPRAALAAICTTGSTTRWFPAGPGPVERDRGSACLELRPPALPRLVAHGEHDPVNRAVEPAVVGHDPRPDQWSELSEHLAAAAEPGGQPGRPARRACRTSPDLSGSPAATPQVNALGTRSTAGLSGDLLVLQGLIIFGVSRL